MTRRRCSRWPGAWLGTDVPAASLMAAESRRSTAELEVGPWPTRQPPDGHLGGVRSFRDRAARSRDQRRPSVADVDRRPRHLEGERFWRALRAAVGTAVVVGDDPLRLLAIALLAHGHALVEDV